MRLRLRYIYLIAFMAVAYVLLPVLNSDYLFTIQDNSVFINGHTFMADTLHYEGGWATWVACYLTQFFYHPWLGSTMLIVLWVVIYLLTIFLFSINDKFSPLALILPGLLLLNLLDYGYWIYYAKTPGFAFLPTLIALFVLLCSSLVLPLLKRTRLNQPLRKALPAGLCLIFFAISAVTIWTPRKEHILNHHCSLNITLADANFRHELSMYRAVDEGRYADCIQELIEAQGTPTNLMVLLKNIALMHTGRLTDMFKTPNCGTLPTRNEGDTLQVQISQLAAPLVYYQFGQMNYSYRWALENSVQQGLSFRNLKFMTLSAIFNNEFDLASKYLRLLKASIFHRQWALEHERWLLDRNSFIRSTDYQRIVPLLFEDVNTLDSDNGLCEKYLLTHFADLVQPSSPQLEDIIMCLSLWVEDEYAFCVHFYHYVQRHPQQPIPTLYQEGAILLCTAERSPVQLNHFPFDQVVADRYNRFVQDYNTLSSQGLSEADMANRMRVLYGDTYWWYYYFYTDFHIY